MCLNWRYLLHKVFTFKVNRDPSTANQPKTGNKVVNEERSGEDIDPTATIEWTAPKVENNDKFKQQVWINYPSSAVTKETDDVIKTNDDDSVTTEPNDDVKNPSDDVIVTNDDVSVVKENTNEVNDDVMSPIDDVTSLIDDVNNANNEVTVGGDSTEESMTVEISVIPEPSS